MLLKRHFQRLPGGADGFHLAMDAGVPVLTHIEVKHTGTTPDQHFSTRLVAAGLAEGWITIDGQTLTLHAEPEDLTYHILRTPGRYPSTTEPSGYEVINYYDCLLEISQHAAFCAQAKGGLHG